MMFKSKSLCWVFGLLSACAAQASEAFEDDVAQEVATPGVRIVFAGDGAGHVEVVDPQLGLVASCMKSCTVAATPGQELRLTAATPSVYGGLSGACTTSGPECFVTVGAGLSKVTATFSKLPGEVFSKFFDDGSIRSAAFDAAGRLVFASRTQVTKLNANGGTVWQQPLAVCNLTTGPGNTIYAQSSTSVLKLAASGAVLWQQPLDGNSTGCGRDDNGYDGFVHNIAVDTTGAVVVHGDNGIARWDSNGTQAWSIALEHRDVYGVAIDPHGIVHAAVLGSNVEAQDLRRFQPDGTELAALERVTPQYHGMVAIDPVGRLLVTSSGHSHTDLLGRSVHLSDADFAPNGVAAAASDAVWFREDNDDDFFARDWTLERIHADGSSSSFKGSYQRLLVDGDSLGTNPHDVAGALDGRAALVGTFHNREFDRGWVSVYAP